MNALKPLFPEIIPEAWPRLEAWAALMREWNPKINLVSRKDIENLESRHLAHCLAITRILKLMHGARVLDVGTGGGLPGLPMAICYPQAHFLLIDSVGKKIKVVEDIAERLEINNVDVRHGRVETLNRQFDFVTGRAVTALPEFAGWVKALLRRGAKHSLENGILYWKGGDLKPELDALRIRPRHTFRVQDYLPDPWFAEKYIVHLLAQDLKHAKKG